MKHRISLLFLNLIVVLSHPAFPQSYTVRGEVLFNGKGSVFISLVDKDSFLQPEKAIFHQVFPYPFPINAAPFPSTPDSFTPIQEKATGTSSFILSFQFAGIPEGMYAIVAFLDENGNGTLDKGLFGPTEPWGMSFRSSRPRFRAPRFEDARFKVPEEVRYFRIELVK